MVISRWCCSGAGGAVGRFVTIEDDVEVVISGWCCSGAGEGVGRTSTN